MKWRIPGERPRDPATRPLGVPVVPGARASAEGAAAHGAGAPSIDQRLERLSTQVTKGKRLDMPRFRRALVTLGVMAMSMGLLAIVLGWYGAAHSPYLFQEVPYLISGGLLGVALVGIGAALFLAAWVLIAVEALNRQTAALSRLAPQQRSNGNGSAQAGGGISSRSPGRPEKATTGPGRANAS